MELGRALQNGRRYAIVVDSAWQDAHGQPLKSTYRHELRAGPAIERPISLGDWRIEAPAAGTRDALAIVFPWALDHELLQRAVGVARRGGAALDGTIALDRGDTRWVFTPAQPWQRGTHEVVVNSPITVSYAASPASFGVQLTKTGITGDVVVAEPADGCTDITSPVAGKIALIDRGTCEFGLKALNARLRCVSPLYIKHAVKRKERRNRIDPQRRPSGPRRGAGRRQS